jgi:enoyl-CoA hydratase
MNFQNIIAEVIGKTLLITINRPDKLNALNKMTLAEIGQAVKLGNEHSEVYGMVITGSGAKAFAAGADISEFANFNVEEGTELSAHGHGVYNSIEHSRKVVIAAVNGFALGGGCELAMACHLRLASPNAKFGQPEVNLGVIPGYAGTQRLVQLVGKGKALELLLTGDAISAEEGHRLGLVNHVVEQTELIGKSMEMIDKIANKGPISVSKCIELVNKHLEPSQSGFDQEIVEFGKMFGTEEFKEGTQAFLEKRKAVFKPLN